MSGISTSSSDSHEFILVPDAAPRTSLVSVAAPPVRNRPASPPRTATPHRRLVKRSHAASPSVEDVVAQSSPSPPLPSTPPLASSRHSRNPSSSPGRSSPRERSPGSPPIIASHESLVGDVQMSRTRVIISKTHTVYDPPGVPFPSALIGFRATFHSPPATSARVRDAEVTLRFLSSQVGSSAPVIKAICPSPGSQGVGPSTSVTDSVSTHAGIHLGYTTGGNLELSRTSSTSFTRSTQARLSSSGVETNELWLTLSEDSTTRQGIPSNIDFACLIQLTSPPPFEAELSVGVTIGRGPSALLKMLSSPQEWIALYDGTTSLNPLSLSTSPPPGGSTLRPSGLVAPTVTDDEGRDEGAATVQWIRAVKRQPSTLEC